MITRRELNYYFSNGTGVWTAAEKDLAASGLRRWRLLRQSNGLSFVDADEVSASTPGAVRLIREDPDVGENTSTACSNIGGFIVPRIYFNPEYGASPSNPMSWARGAAHEGGHALGLDHDGNRDSFMWNGARSSTGRQPRLNGCTTEAVPNSDWPESDDFTQYENKLWAETSNFAQFSTDWEFNTYAFADALPSSDARYKPGRMWAGVGQLHSAGTDHYVSVGYAAGTSVPLRFQSRVTDPGTFRMFGQMDFYAGGANVGANMKLKYRAINYPSGAPTCNGGWPSDVDYNNPELGAWTTIGNGSSPNGSTDWTTMTVEAPLRNYGEGADFYVEVHSTSSSSPIYLDGVSMHSAAF